MKAKKIALLGLTALSAIGLTGCSGSSSQADVVFWHTMGKDNMAMLDTMITEFNKIYPDITVEHAAQGGFDDLKAKTSKAIEGNNHPTIAFAYPDHVASYLSNPKNVVANLDQFINSTELMGNPKDETEIVGFTAAEQADFIEGYWNEGKVYDTAGTMYSFPFAKSTEVMYYNKTVFEALNIEVPQEWDELWAAAAKIKAHYDALDADIADESKKHNVIPFGYDSSDNMFITLLEQYGIPYTSSDSTNHYLFDNVDAKARMTEIQGYHKAGLFTTKDLQNNTYTSDLFKAQTLMMTVSSTGGAKYNEPAKDGTTGEYEFEYGVAPIPQASLDNAKVIQQGPSIVMFDHGVDTNSDNWKFIKFITNTANTTGYACSTGYLPVRYSALNGEAFNDLLAEDTIISRTLAEAKAQVNYVYTSPAFNGSSQAREQAAGIIKAICTGTTTVDEAFKAAMEALTK